VRLQAVGVCGLPHFGVRRSGLSGRLNCMMRLVPRGWDVSSSAAPRPRPRIPNAPSAGNAAPSSSRPDSHPLGMYLVVNLRLTPGTFISYLTAAGLRSRTLRLHTTPSHPPSCHGSVMHAESGRGPSFVTSCFQSASQSVIKALMRDAKGQDRVSHRPSPAARGRAAVQSLAWVGLADRLLGDAVLWRELMAPAASSSSVVLRINPPR
jgi:hypothetical protein